MTAVAKIHLLPAPGTRLPVPAGTAAQSRGVPQEVEAVVRSPALKARDEQAAQQHGPLHQRRGDEPEAQAGSSRATRQEASAKERPISFSRLSSMPFMVQVLGQEGRAAKSATPAAPGGLSEHRDGALMGSDLYRKAGGEPELLPETATLVRFAV